MEFGVPNFSRKLLLLEQYTSHFQIFYHYEIILRILVHWQKEAYLYPPFILF